MKNEKLYAIFIGFFSIVLVIFALAVPVQGLRKKQLDQQTATALSEIESSLGEYIANNNGDLPKSVNDLDFGEYSSLKNNKSTLDRITIEGDKNNYKLCGFFYTDTNKDDEQETGNDIGSTFKYFVGGAGAYGNRFSMHDKGNYCFDSENYPAEDYGGGVDIYNYPALNDGSDSASDKSNDASRKSEINAIYGQVEVYFAENGNYPSFDDMNNPNFRSTELSGLSTDTITDPTGILEQFTNTPTQATYSYEAAPEGCDNVSKNCTTMKLSATLSSGELYTKTGSNN